MHTVFAIAPARENFERLLDSLEANSISLGDVRVAMPDERGGTALPDMSAAVPLADDFSGNPTRARLGGAIGALIGMGVFALSGIPGVVAAGAGTLAMGASVAGAAGGTIGAMLGLQTTDSAAPHYESRLKRGGRLVWVRISSERVDDVTGLFVREGMEDIAVREENQMPHAAA